MIFVLYLTIFARIPKIWNFHFNFFFVILIRRPSVNANARKRTRNRAVAPMPRTNIMVPPSEKIFLCHFPIEPSLFFFFKGKSAYAVDESAEALQKELYVNGPVEVAFEVYEDFMNYKGGVYIVRNGWNRNKANWSHIRILRPRKPLNTYFQMKIKTQKKFFQKMGA